MVLPWGAAVLATLATLPSRAVLPKSESSNDPPKDVLMLPPCSSWCASRKLLLRLAGVGLGRTTTWQSAGCNCNWASWSAPHFEPPLLPCCALLNLLFPACHDGERGGTPAVLVDEVQPMGVSVEQWEAGGLNVEGGAVGASVALQFTTGCVCLTELVRQSPLLHGMQAIASRPTQLKF